MWSVLHIRHKQKKSLAGLPTPYLQCQRAFPQRRKNPPQELLQITAWLQFCKSIVPTGERTTGWKEIKIQTGSPPASATHAEEPAWLFGNGDRADLLLASESLSAASQIIFSSELSILNFQTGKSEQYCSGKKLVSSAFPCSRRRRAAHARTTPVPCLGTCCRTEQILKAELTSTSQLA